ncbi:anti-sigma factor family protein [Paraburkholderia sp. 2C]
MDHERAFELIAGYVDEELGLSEALDFEHHLAGCQLCQEQLAKQKLARSRLKHAHLQVETPDDLSRRISAALSTQKSMWRRLGELFRLPGRTNPFAWAPVGAVAISALALSGSAGLYLSIPSSESRLSHELLDNHIRSLQENHLIDVISTDRHTVKPWFNGKLDYTPPVVDLAQQGYALVGGRMDVVNGRPVSVLVYRYKLHPINLYVWPGSDARSSTRITERDGYHLAHWNAAGMDFWAVTDAGEEELSGFVDDLRTRASP